MEDAPNQAMKGVKEFEATYEMVTDFRKDYDKLMDAVHYFSVMRGTSEEDDAIARLRQVYQYNQDKWGG
jgi:hypothetical protein